MGGPFMNPLMNHRSQHHAKMTTIPEDSGPMQFEYDSEDDEGYGDTYPDEEEELHHRNSQPNQHRNLPGGHIPRHSQYDVSDMVEEDPYFADSFQHNQHIDHNSPDPHCHQPWCEGARQRIYDYPMPGQFGGYPSMRDAIKYKARRAGRAMATAAAIPFAAAYLGYDKSRRVGGNALHKLGHASLHASDRMKPYGHPGGGAYPFAPAHMGRGVGQRVGHSGGGAYPGFGGRNWH